MELVKKIHKPLLVMGIVFQVLISAITYHPDLRAFVLASKFINQGEVFTFYDHVSKLPSSDQIKKIYGDDIFIYPPLSYLVPALFYAPFSGLLDKAYDQIIYTDSIIYQKYSIYPSFLVFKLPFLFSSLLILLLLPKLFKKESNGRLAQLLWIYNPTNLLVTSGMGQVDVILALFLLIAFYFLRKTKYGYAGILIALSALVKPTGLVLLPLLGLYVYGRKGMVEAIKSILPGIITWGLMIAPFALSPAFRMYALFAQHTAKTTFAGIQISGAVAIPWFFIAFSLIALRLYEKKISLLISLGLTILSVLAFNHFHPQWFLWFTPFLIIYALKHKKMHLYWLSLISWILIWLSFDPSLHAGMILWFKQALPPTMESPLAGSSLTLLARAFLVGLLVHLGTKHYED